jgi:hypothetical protein
MSFPPVRLLEVVAKEKLKGRSTSKEITMVHLGHFLVGAQGNRNR